MSLPDLTQHVDEVRELPWVQVHMVSMKHALEGSQIFNTMSMGPCGGSRAHLCWEVNPEVATGASPCSIDWWSSLSWSTSLLLT
jgi:hypothetical protein